MTENTQDNKAKAVPTLTLGTSDEQKQMVDNAVQQLEKIETAQENSKPLSSEAQKAIAAQFEAALSDEEKKQVESFSKQIDLHNPEHVMLYGAEAQKKVSDFADTILADVKNKDTGDVGDMLGNLIGELKTFENSTEKPKGIKAWFTNAEKHAHSVRAKFDSVNQNVENIASALENHQVQLLKDVSMLNTLYDKNLEYFKELTMYIAAGEKLLEEVRNTELKQLKEEAAKSGDALDAQKAADLDSACDRFEKKLHDLKLTRQVSLQMAPQIRLLQNNDSLLIERIQSTLVNTLPLWKNQMVLSLGLEHGRQAVRSQKAVTDMTNELLKKNAETLKMGTIETAKEAERGIVDISTLVETNQSLIDTMTEVARIQDEGRKQRKEAEATLVEIESNLKKYLIEG
ncbi:MAG: toxic anion resistance protein [Eubacteriales bacterium]|nr:toxic anion resistance protein [Eubacteriales bacterium]